MASNGTESRSGRETRLLVLVVGVAIAVLLVLARFRFPTADLAVTPSAAPLAGLAARATFDEMANTLADVLGRVSPLVIVVPLEPAAEDPETPGTGRAGAAGSEARNGANRPAARPAATEALAIRVRSDRALMHVPSGTMPRSTPDMTIDVAAHDPSREMMLLRVSASAGAPDTLSASIRTFPGFTFLAAIAPTRVGPTIQPIFVGRSDSINDPRWSHPLVPAGAGQNLTPGSVVFGINGRLVGMVIDSEGGPMIVPAPALETLVAALEGGGTTP